MDNYKNRTNGGNDKDISMPTFVNSRQTRESRRYEDDDSMLRQRLNQQNDRDRAKVGRTANSSNRTGSSASRNGGYSRNTSSGTASQRTESSRNTSSRSTSVRNTSARTTSSRTGSQVSNRSVSSAGSGGSGSTGQRRTGKRRKKNRVGRRIAVVIMAIISVVAGGVAANFQYNVSSAFSKMNRDTTTDLSSVVDDSSLLSDDDIVNILLIGSDKRSTWTQAGRSDSVMIATIDNQHKQLKLTSLMRDMYVDIPGYESNRFNAAYSLGGVSLLYETIAQNFGIKIDGYVLVDFAAFEQVIDTVGGVKIELTQAEYEYLTTAYHRGSVLKLVEGVNLMNGEQALAYSRIRQDSQGDFGRTARQRKVLSAIFKEAKAMSLTELYSMMNEVLPNVTTDLSDDDIVSYMKTVLLMGTTELNQMRIPVDNSYTNETIRTMKVLVPDLEANKEALSEFIFGDAEAYLESAS